MKTSIHTFNLRNLYVFLLCISIPLTPAISAAPESKKSLKEREKSLTDEISTPIEKIWNERTTGKGGLLEASVRRDEVWKQELVELLRHLNHEKRREGRNNLPEISAALFSEVSLLLAQGDISFAVVLLEHAVMLSPSISELYFVLAKVYLLDLDGSIANTFSLLLRGAQSYLNNFNSLVVDSGNIYLFLLLSLTLCFLIYVPLLVIRNCRPLLHDIRHLPFLNLTPRQIQLLSLFLVLLIIVFSSVLQNFRFEILTILLLILSPFYKKSERLIAGFFTILFLMMPLLSSVGMSFVNYSTSFTQQIVNINMGIFDVKKLAILDQKIAKEEDKDPHQLFSLGVFYLKAGDDVKAIRHFEHLIQINPEYAKAYVNLGTAYFYEGKFENAQFSYNRALELNRDSTAANYNFSRLLFLTTQNIEARDRHLERANQLDPELVSTYTKKGEHQRNLMIEELSKLELLDVVFSSSLLNTPVLKSVIAKDLRLLYRDRPATPFLFIVFILALLVITARYRRVGICSGCAKITCNHCDKTQKAMDLCWRCRTVIQSNTDIDSVDRVYRLMNIKTKHRMQSLLAISLSFIVPGVGHYIIGKVFIGLMISVVFFVFILKLFFFNGILIDAMDLSLVSVSQRYAVFAGLFLFFYTLIIHNILYEVKIYNGKE